MLNFTWPTWKTLKGQKGLKIYSQKSFSRKGIFGEKIMKNGLFVKLKGQKPYLNACIKNLGLSVLSHEKYWLAHKNKVFPNKNFFLSQIIKILFLQNFSLKCF